PMQAKRGLHGAPSLSRVLYHEREVVMSVAIITGSAGLIGSEAATFFAGHGLDVVGIDNDMRSQFFGAEASTAWNQQRLKSELGKTYRHSDFDIRDTDRINKLFADLGSDIALVIHTAAQPSH